MKPMLFTYGLLALAPLGLTCALAAAPVRSAPAVSPAIIALPLNPVVAEPQRKCGATTASGLGYSALRPSSEKAPGAGDIALINYIGYLAASGEVFDQAMRVAMPVDRMIPGFTEGLKLMGRGSVYRLCVPAALGYGPQASGPIPANADLVFQVEMLEFKTEAEIEAMRKQQEQANAAAKPAP